MTWLVSCVFGCGRIGFNIASTPTGTNAEECTCDCFVHPLLVDIDVETKHPDVCVPFAINPNNNANITPSVAQLKADCEGRVTDAFQMLARCTHGCTPDGPLHCSCTLDETNPRSFVTNDACNQDCPGDAAHEIPSCFDSPGVNVTLMELKAAGYTWTGDDVEGCSGLEPGHERTADTSPVCIVPNSDPPLGPPTGLVALIGPASTGIVTGGGAEVSVGDNHTTTSVAGTVTFSGAPCPGGACGVGVAANLGAGAVQFSSFLGLGTVQIANIRMSTASGPSAAALDTSGVGTFPPASIVGTAIGTKKTLVAGVVTSTENRGFDVTNTGPVTAHVDWTGHTFGLADAFAATSTGSTAITVSVALDGMILNEPPTADAGPATQTVECTSPAGADVALMGAATDPEDNITLAFWRRAARGPALPNGTNITVPQPLGTARYEFRVSDSFGQLAEASTTVTVVDTTPPTFESVVVTPSCLWPPNHDYVRFVLGEDVVARVKDTCDPNPTVRIFRVVSDQPDAAPGSGNTSRDVLFGASGFCIRSERAATLGVRAYTITLEARDAAGNLSTHDVTVVVPHDQRADCPALPPTAFLTDEEAVTRCVFP